MLVPPSRIVKSAATNRRRSALGWTWFSPFPIPDSFPGTPMTSLTLVGAGKIGEAIIHLLARTGDYRLRVVDADAQRLAPMSGSGAECITADISREGELARLVEGQDVVVSACPFYLTPAIA